MGLPHETNTGFTGTPGRLEVRQWTPDERAAFPDLTGNTLRMRLDEAAATPGDRLQCLPATPPRRTVAGAADPDFDSRRWRRGRGLPEADLQEERLQGLEQFQLPEG